MAVTYYELDPDALVTREGGIDQSKIERFRRWKSQPPPIVVFQDNDGSRYVVDGTHRTSLARLTKGPVVAQVIEDGDYQIKGTDVLTLVLRMIFKVDPNS